MSNSKNRLALFELYDKGCTTEVDPQKTVRKTGSKAPSRADSGFQETLSSVARDIGSDKAKAENTEAKPKRTPSEPESRSMLEVESGRVLLALSRRGLMLAALAIVLVAGVIYTGGQYVGRKGGLADGEIVGREQGQQRIQRAVATEIEQARRSAPVEGLFANVGKSPVNRTANPTPAAVVVPKTPVTLMATTGRGETNWITGYTYIVVQSFRGDARDDAVRAQEYLAQHGVDTEIFGSVSRGFRLITTKGFNRKEATGKKQSDRFVRKLRGIGSAYFEAGGRYKLEGYFATRTPNSW